MLNPLDNWYGSQQEPARSCLLAVRKHLLDKVPDLTEAWKYGMPFFCYRNKMLCYVWLHKTTGYPYLGLVDGKLIGHPALIQDKRKRMKIFPIDPVKDLPLDIINGLLDDMLALRK